MSFKGRESISYFTFAFLTAFLFSFLSSAMDFNNSSYVSSGDTDSRSVRSGQCGSVPSEVMRVAEGMISLRNSCAALSVISNRNKPVMVADLSNDDGNAYVFDASGTCVRLIDSNSWGHGYAGPRSDVDPQPCSQDESYHNPAGLHVTGPHNGDKYNNSNSLKMYGLDGQDSESRHVLIHGGHPWATSSSIGCNAMSNDDFSYCQENMGHGALVYNYFGATQPDSQCNDTSGLRPNGGLPDCSSFTQHLLPPVRPDNRTPEGGNMVRYSFPIDDLQFFLNPKLASLFALKEAKALGITEPPIRAGAAIEPIKYDAEMKVYELRLTNYPAVGPNYADFKKLMKALGFSPSQIEEYKNSPSSIIGVQVNLRSKLELLNFSQLKARFPKYRLANDRKRMKLRKAKNIRKESFKKRVPASKQGSE